MAKAGSKENPHTEDSYQQLLEEDNWNGGWVSMRGGAVYITALNTIEKDTNGYVLGSQDNPFSATAYNEMHAAETWPGGYVRENATTVVYHRSSEDEAASSCGCSSSGSGSGSGNEETSGSGSGGNGYITMGRKEIINQESGAITVSLVWGSGYTSSTPMASIEVHVLCKDPYAIKSNNLSVFWIGTNLAQVTGNLAYHRVEGHLLTINLVVDAEVSVP